MDEAIARTSRLKKLCGLRIPPSMRLCTRASSENHKKDRCTFAHKLYELRLPSCGKSKAWDDNRIDRWCGQALSEDQRNLFHIYWHSTPPQERPLWAVALDWHLRNGSTDEHPNLPWDFGLFADWWPVSQFVKKDEELWSKLMQRLQQ